MEQIRPISKAIYEKAKSLGIETISLQFTGGNDEGALQVDVDPYDSSYNFEKEIEDWAWEAYQYNGGGDGDDYGDDITYNLKDGTASSSNWYTSRCDGQSTEKDIEITPE